MISTDYYCWIVWDALIKLSLSGGIGWSYLWIELVGVTEVESKLLLGKSYSNIYDTVICANLCQWWACRTHDLVVVSSIPGWDELSFTSAEARGKSSWWLWREKFCYYWREKARKHMCVTDRHDMTLTVKVNAYATNQQQTYFPFHVWRQCYFWKQLYQ